MVNPNTKAFMIAYDDMQAIYKGRRRPVWSQLGIEAKRHAGAEGELSEYRADSGARAADRGGIVGAPGVAADDQTRC
jgi:hypothetical protein